MVLAIAGVLGSVAVASAQPGPPPGEPPPPPPNPVVQPPAPPPPPAEFGVAPAALPAAPIQVVAPPVANFNATPGADTATPEEAPKKPNPFRFTRFTWGNSASTKIFGVGRDYIGTDDEEYSMDFTLGLRYYVVDQPKDTVYVGASLGWQVELTNSDSSTKQREVFFKDLTLSSGYGRVLYKSANKENSTSLGVSVNGVIPTSLASRMQGKYFTLGTGLALIQSVGLAGSKSDWFPDVLMFAAGSYSHLFSRATTPTNEGAVSQRPRQNAGPACTGADCNIGAFSDQLSASRFGIDNVKASFTYYLTIYKDLSLGNTWEYAHPIKPEFSNDPCVNLSTGCANIQGGVDPTNGKPTTSFDIGFSYLLFDVVRTDLGYNNTAPALGADGKRQSMFYSVNAQFYGNLAVYLDNIIDKVRTSAAKKSAANKPNLALGRWQGGRN